ncbi:MAG: polyprenyl synthetase family protein [Thermoplasmata archaeon]|nr:MAG: polyprenyl synthetase family protein [Thermoplasmata archaeon]
MDIENMLGDRIETVNKALTKALDIAEQEKLGEAMRHIPMAGGKRLRPILAMLTADAISGRGERALPFGVSLELIHNFTLLHDDVMDKDELRRGVKTVHVLFDEATAINAGDVLFARAFETLSTTDVTDNALRGLVREVATAVRKIGEGQQMDKEYEMRTDISEKDYLKMIEYKTAKLFQIAAWGGAIVAEGNERQIQAMSDYGRLLGMGFQIWDDYLDLKADEKLLGKPVGSDIKNGKRTLMVVHALERLKGEKRAEFLRVLGNENASQKEVENAIAIMQEMGSTAYAKNMAFDFTNKSKELLDVLSDSEYKDVLLEITDYMVQRKK